MNRNIILLRLKKIMSIIWNYSEKKNNFMKNSLSIYYIYIFFYNRVFFKFNYV